MFSSRADVDAQPNRLTRALEERRSRGDRIIDLTLSNPTEAALPELPAAALSALADRRGRRYAPRPLGDEGARRAVAEALGRPALVDRMMLTASTSEAYGFLFKLLCDPGDEVLVPQPSYPLLAHLARLEGVTLVPYDLLYDGLWHVDLAGVEAAVSPRTRALVVVHPNNPTGSLLGCGEFASLRALGLPIIADEVFGAYPLEVGHDRLVSVRDAPASEVPVFVLGGLSKWAGLPQLKVAWCGVHAHPVVAQRCLARLELLGDTMLSLATPQQLALPVILEASSAIREAILRRLGHNLQRLDALRPDDSPVTRLTVEGGWYAILRLPQLLDDEGWALELLEREGIYAHPGHFYDLTADAHLVVSLLVPEPIFEAAVSALYAHVDRVCVR